MTNPRDLALDLKIAGPRRQYKSFPCPTVTPVYYQSCFLNSNYGVQVEAAGGMENRGWVNGRAEDDCRGGVLTYVTSDPAKSSRA